MLVKYVILPEEQNSSVYVIDKVSEILHSFSYVDETFGSIEVIYNDLDRDYEQIFMFKEKIKDLSKIKKVSQKGIEIYTNIALHLYNEVINEKLIDRLISLQMLTNFHFKTKEDLDIDSYRKIMESSLIFKLNFLNEVKSNNVDCKNCTLCNKDYFEWGVCMVFFSDGTIRLSNYLCDCKYSCELANIYEDENITYELLIEREKRLHNHLKKRELLHNDRNYMCNNICSRYKVTKEGIMRDDKIVERF